MPERGQDMTILIEDETEGRLAFDFEAVIRKAVETSLDDENCPYEACVSVIITDDDTIARFNKDYRGIDRSTDVLSFPMLSYEEPGNFEFLETAGAEDYFDPESGELILGDIILSADHIIDQAFRFGHSQQRELGFLTVHSMLHLFGYDHMEETERLIMEERQKMILNKMNLKR